MRETKGLWLLLLCAWSGPLLAQPAPAAPQPEARQPQAPEPEAADAGAPSPTDASVEADASDATLSPPRLKEMVPAQLPEGVTLPAEGLRVLVALTIDTQGHVTEASLAPSATGDAALLEAVLAAARQLSFEPARRGAAPIAARIQFEYRLTPPPDATPLTPEEPPATSPAAVPAPNAVASATPASYAATARIEAPPREVTRRELTAEQVGRIAGTRGDALRAVEILPGVARPPANDPIVVVRGASPQDTQVLVEGTPVLFLYHVGGLTSFFNAALLKRVDFYPGNFSARFGRAMGGVIDVDVRSPRSDQGHGTLDVNLIDASLLVEAPISDRGGFAIAARRSYIDFFFDSLVPDDAFDVVAAPVYWDYQAIAEYRVTDRDRLRLQAFGSRDQLSIITNKPDEQDPEVRGAIGFSSEFHRGLLSWLHDYGDTGARHELMVGLGTLDIDATIGKLMTQHINAPTVFSRAEWHLPMGDALTLDTGWDVVGYRGRVFYDGPRFLSSDNEDPAISDGNGRLDRIATILRPAAFAELTWMPHPALRVVPGVRVDHTTDAKQTTVDPRLSTRWAVTDETTLKAGVGLFSQPPELGTTFPEIGNPDLDGSRSLHTSIGMEQRVGESLQLGVELYGKALWDLAVNDVDGGASPINDGKGRIFGMEVSARYQHGRTFGFLAYTLSRSERSIRGGPWRVHDYDQPHILNISAGYDLGRGWDLSGTFRLVSGNPQTPVIGAVYDADEDDHQPVYGPSNSARGDLFHRLDLRIQKRWDLGFGKLSLYLDLINAYNAQHAEATEYNFDYRDQSSVSGLPLLPVLGVRGEI